MSPFSQPPTAKSDRRWTITVVFMIFGLFVMGLSLWLIVQQNEALAEEGQKRDVAICSAVRTGDRNARSLLMAAVVRITEPSTPPEGATPAQIQGYLNANAARIETRRIVREAIDESPAPPCPTGAHR